MKISYINTYLKSLIEVEVEGYFVERLINLCRFNNIKIWDIEYVDNGKITFKMASSEFKKLKPYIKKSKCKVKIKSKSGIYFNLFRYRKRRIIVYLTILLFISFLTFSNFIWKIEIIGNEKVKKETIEKLIEESGVYIGKVKQFISKGKVADYIRANLYETAWIGVDIKGTTIRVTVKEKKISNEEDKSINGNIVAKKSAVITKIIAENGTSLYKTGSYINKGDIAIKGIIESKFLDPEYVHASGIIRGIVEYKFVKEYKYKEQIKEFVNKSRYGAGIKINNKEFIIKYLPKEFKYDINNKCKKISVFGVDISFVFNTYEAYIFKDIVNTKDTLIKRGEQDINLFLSDILIADSKLENKEVEIVETKEGIIYKATLIVDENIGEFVETGDK